MQRTMQSTRNFMTTENRLPFLRNAPLILGLLYAIVCGWSCLISSHFRFRPPTNGISNCTEVFWFTTHSAGQGQLWRGKGRKWPDWEYVPFQYRSKRLYESITGKRLRFLAHRSVLRILRFMDLHPSHLESVVWSPNKTHRAQAYGRLRDGADGADNSPISMVIGPILELYKRSRTMWTLLINTFRCLSSARCNIYAHSGLARPDGKWDFGQR